MTNALGWLPFRIEPIGIDSQPYAEQMDAMRDRKNPGYSLSVSRLIVGEIREVLKHKFLQFVLGL